MNGVINLLFETWVIDIKDEWPYLKRLYPYQRCTFLLYFDTIYFSNWSSSQLQCAHSNPVGNLVFIRNILIYIIGVKNQLIEVNDRKIFLYK